MNDGKVAKEIAVHFFNAINVNATSKRFMITIQQAKALLKNGYNQEDIIAAIDYFVAHPPFKGIYSLGFINTSIDVALNAIKAEKEKKKLSSNITPLQGGVNSESTRNNADKLQRRSDECGFGKKYNFDLFKEPR